MVGGRVPASLRWIWKARTSSAVAVSGGRRKNAASFLTARTYSRCVSGEKLRTAMSSSMRRRSGLTVSGDVKVIGGLLVLRLEVRNPSILKTEHPPRHPMRLSS